MICSQEKIAVNNNRLEVIQMLDWADNGFKSVIIDMFIESNKNMGKIWKEKYSLMDEEIENLSREMKIVKKKTKSKF